MPPVRITHWRKIVRIIVRLALAATLLAGTCSISFADGPGSPPCYPGAPNCPGGGGNGGALHLPTNGLVPSLVEMR
jgi:hypothetical protein